MKPILLIVFACVSFAVTAQQNDFILLKKAKGKTVVRFFRGSYINFMTSEKEPVNGIIKKIARDSIWVSFQEVIRSMTQFGGIISDTITYEARRFSVKEIAYVQKEQHGFTQAVPSALLKIGGAGYLFLHVFNSIYQKEKVEAGKVAMAGGAYLLGVLLNRLKKDYYVVGKRFRIQYVSL